MKSLEEISLEIEEKFEAGQDLKEAIYESTKELSGLDFIRVVDLVHSWYLT